MRQLGSKIVAGGLSAAVILLWWPSFFAGDSSASWLCRGVAWTLFFELLLHALAPLEAALWETRRAHAVRRRAAETRAKLELESPRRRLGVRTALASLALAAPLALLVAAPDQRPAPARAAVRQVTEIKRIVRVKRVQVPVATTTQPGGSAAQAGASQLASSAPAPRPSYKPRTTVRPRRSASRSTQPKRTTGRAPSRQPSNASTPAAPTAPVTPQPAG